MRFLIDYLHQQAPRASREMPAYFRRALTVDFILMSAYYLTSFVLFFLAERQWEIVPLAVCAAAVISTLNMKRMGPRLSLAVNAGITLLWCFWYVRGFGWDSGVQTFLVLLLTLNFFNIYETPRLKLCVFAALLGFRMFLYGYALNHAPIHVLEPSALILQQTVNSVAFYLIMTCLCIMFSTSLQDTERQLRIDNQELQKEAETDPLTQLPNRRAMMDELDLFQRKSPGEPFSVAIADIDFFKKVNDTYGHNCGDYTLKQLSRMFQEMAGLDYRVCRWGGEEFCFFMPGMNLDQAGGRMNDLCAAVSRMQVSFEGHEFSITITIGVAENDFQSPVRAILAEADQKLYIGKNSGRNQVVI